MTDRATEVTVRVRYGETDQMGVVYHANYLVWCEIGRTEHLRALGATYRDMERSGVRLAVAEASIRYHAPARYDDVVRIRTTLDDVGSRMVVFGYDLSNAETGERFAAARTTLIAIDDAGKVTRIPADVRALLERGAAAAS
jgi:acyl-CoA thioester hydrolase